MGAIHLAGVVDQDDGDAVFVRDPVERGDREVVEPVEPTVAIGHADLLECVDDDQARIRMGHTPGVEPGDAAIAAWPLGHDLQSLRPFGEEGREQLVEAGLQTTTRILEGEIKHVALRRLEIAEDKAIGGNRDGDVEHEP
jgi:hypothetical protein